MKKMNNIKLSNIVKVAAVLFTYHFSLLTSSAQIGEPYIHDPSTLAECDGKYYTFGTGGGGLISADGWSWFSGADRPVCGRPDNKGRCTL